MSSGHLLFSGAQIYDQSADPDRQVRLILKVVRGVLDRFQVARCAKEAQGLFSTEELMKGGNGSQDCLYAGQEKPGYAVTLLPLQR